MCRIIKTKSETLALILRAQYVNEVWKKAQTGQPPTPVVMNARVPVPKETP
jgi:hypothetical protein